MLVREGRLFQSGLVGLPVRLEGLLGGSQVFFSGFAGSGRLIRFRLGLFQGFLFPVQLGDFGFHGLGLPGQFLLGLAGLGGRVGMVRGTAHRAGLPGNKGRGHPDGFP